MRNLSSARAFRIAAALFAAALLLATLFLTPAAFAQTVPGRYILQLAEEPVAATRRNAIQSTVQRRARVSAQQSVARRAVERISQTASILESVDTVTNALIVAAPGVSMAELAAIPGVKRVLPVARMKYNLNRALPLLKVPEAWERAGGAALAGIGIKIGIIDSGIDQDHPGFQDPSLQIPEGFPRANRPDDVRFTNNKVIVARSYGYLYGGVGDGGPRDHLGHGTAVAMVAAGVPHVSPIGLISGVAPKAFLGAYNVAATGLPGDDQLLGTDAIMKAFDDAVADGMDVINLSLGSELAFRPLDDLFSEMITNATRMGVVVVTASGNQGSSPQTVGSPGTATDAITVGASSSDRSFEASVEVGGATYRALPGDSINTSEPLTAPLLDTAAIGDTTGLGCRAFTRNRLAGRIALIQRGTCNFSVKLTNA
ncbi:MAG: S8 family serine peptidase, partial [Bryobacteraceae bacterium]